ncbi:MAG: alpha/beta hydrolase fold protein [Rhodocyclaceae bacterium]|nr:MAG: alpha/beta hydrolase fold protein [Rhodocyclaceae bacterium]TND01298.1 MAG: alpha/beta hydrolase fold protein [Rhodocyclaceae bacterium]
MSGAPLHIEYESLGDSSHPAIVLIMGLGMQLMAWPDDFCQALVASGYRVIRFDNRDCGLSGRAPGKKRANLLLAMAAAALGLPVRTPYTLEDMAGDAVGLMNRLGIARAHIVGASMGGMIAQVLAAKFPQRVLSLTSIMSSSGNRKVSKPSKPARKVLLARPTDPKDPESVIDHLVEMFGVIGSPDYPSSKEELRSRIGHSVRRAYEPAGTARQLLAIIASGDRRKLLRTIAAPTLVIHGAADPLVPLAAGRDTAQNIPGASLLVIDGMGHDFPAALMPRLAQEIADHCDRHAATPGA